jgi:Ser/Thr protein kinase RdoA (MazF antagonist)
METFPVQYSTLSAAALQRYIQNQYGYTGLNCRLLLHGVSDTYLLENHSPQFIFKVYRSAHRPPDSVKGELELLNILKEKGAAVSYPISDLKGEQLQILHAPEGPRPGVLYSYARGKSVYDLSDEQLRRIGHEMAKVHNITSATRLSYEREEYDIQRLLVSPLQTVAPAFKDIPDGYTYLQQTAGRVMEKLATLNTATFSYGYCHYDFLPKNFHFDEQNNLTFFDFDFTGKGWLANDVASFFIHFFFHTALNRISQEEAQRCFGVFIAAYREVRPFSEEELAAVPYLGFIFWIFYLGFQYGNFDDWSNAFFSTNYLKDRVGVIKKYVDMHCF